MENDSTPKIEQILKAFQKSYFEALKVDHMPIFETFLKLARAQLKDPFIFEPYHEHITEPFDYYAFGVEFIRPLVDEAHSTVLGHENILEALDHLKRGDNVIFLANHQTEADPQALSILLDKPYHNLAKEMIFVAGERVITDPIAIPFSMGRNLLCIYSKRYIDTPPEQKEEKQLHNKRTMEKMRELLQEGGKAIYVAPSGGRDRANKKGVVKPAPFDSQSIEMFFLMAQKSKRPTFFYPMALSTYDILPPPEDVQVELGEMRIVKHGAIHVAIGKALDMKKRYDPDRKKNRKLRADDIWQQVYNEYKKGVR